MLGYRRRSLDILGIATVLAILVAGCGQPSGDQPPSVSSMPSSSAVPTPSDPTDETPEPTQPTEPTEPTQPTEEPEPEGEEEFSWALPGGDLSVDQIGAIFNLLRAGKCDDARGSFESTLQNGSSFSPGQAQLYSAAIAACSGDLATARTRLAEASLTEHRGDCRLYRAVVSMVEQTPQREVTCPAPENPEPLPGPSTTDASESPQTSAEPSEGTSEDDDSSAALRGPG